MATINTILGSDTITASRTVINQNLTNLNTDKIETSVLDTDTALTANSDTKVATQRAVKAYVDAGGNVNASTTSKGVIELATQEEYSAKTATGATGASLVVPNSIGPVIETTAGVTHSLVTTASQKVIVWAKGYVLNDSGTVTVSLKYNGVTKDSVLVRPSSSGHEIPFALMYTETPGAATQNITVDDNTAASVNSVVIIALKF